MTRRAARLPGSDLVDVIVNARKREAQRGFVAETPVSWMMRMCLQDRANLPRGSASTQASPQLT